MRWWLTAQGIVTPKQYNIVIPWTGTIMSASMSVSALELRLGAPFANMD